MDEQNNLTEKLRQYLSGISSEKGAYLFKEWFDSFDDSKGFLDGVNEDERESYKQQLLHSVKENLDLEQGSDPGFRSSNLITGSKNVYKIAAVLVLGVVITVAGLYITGLFGQEADPARMSMILKSNQAGEITEVILPDRSKVWLGVKSTLRYPEEFTGGNRFVHLDGEAFFDVKNDTARPFIVKSGPVTSRVLGTSFNIKAYKEDLDVKVTLATGKLEVTADNESRRTILTPGQQISYKKGKGLGRIQKVDASLVKVWINKELVFMREPLSRIAKTFERWYGVEFVFEDESLKEELFVYHFDELSLKKSMDILSRIAGFKYQITNNQVIIQAMSE